MSHFAAFDPAGGYDAADFRKLADSLRDVPGNLRAALARKLRPIGERTVADAKARSSWSTRIPGAISLRVSFRDKNPGLVITVDHVAAPHARPFEGLLSRPAYGSGFRHPLFGNTDVWVDQAFRRFVWPAVQATNQDVAREVDAAVDETLAAAGFH